MSTVTRFTLEQYDKMVESGVFDRSNKRLEFIHGEIREMSPIGSRHASAVDWLAAWSFQSTSREAIHVRIQGPTRFDLLESEPEPDVLWLAKKNYVGGHPAPADVELLIEVADSSLKYDLGEKAQLYAEAGIRDYWVVDLIDDCVHVFRDPQPSGFALHTQHRGDEAIAPLTEASAALTPSELFAATHD